MSNVVAQEFDEQGTLLFGKNEIPLNDNEWQQLEDLINQVEYEHVVGGDAGESHSVRVCRFYNDVDRPVALNDRSSDISEIVMSPKMKNFYKQFIGTDQLCLRRCQANLLHEGDYIGVHKDQDSNPDYFATVVFHFGTTYRGGAFVTHGESGTRYYHPTARAALVNNCFIPHEVTVVEHGERRTLACFLSKEFSGSNNQRRLFRVVEQLDFA